jgi:tRNA (guanine37-N1)-methyltransferase
MQIDILSLFPNYFKGPFDESIIMQARKKGLLTINLIDIRTFADNRYRKVDDRPYGGGPGMVMMPQPTLSALRSVKKPGTRVIYLSPQGNLLTADKSRELAKYEHLVLLCGHYEGIDERILDEVDEEISIGDYVLTNGCLSAIVLVDVIVRFVPEVLGHECAACEDSFENGILDYPHYTRPEVFEGKKVPEVLLSGDHKKIAEWRRTQALKKTKRMRPDLWQKLKLSEE